MEYTQRESLDKSNENKVSQVLDEYLYSKDAFTVSGRATDYQTQAVDGIDIYFSTSAHTYSCDEKAATYYMNKDLQTFALELSSYSPKCHCRYPGWFLGNNKKADSYMFIYLNKVDGDVYTFTSGSVKEVEVILVKKDAIFNYLDSMGFPKAEIMRINYAVAEKHEPASSYNRDGIRFHYSFNYEEKSMNLLIPRQVLRQISDYNEVISIA